MQNSKGKSHLLNVIDTPGHVNFVDEVASCARLTDGVILVVDVVEGVRTCLPELIEVFSTDRRDACRRSCQIRRQSFVWRSKSVSR
jgi:translation elongation factor EF-G